MMQGWESEWGGGMGGRDCFNWIETFQDFHFLVFERDLSLIQDFQGLIRHVSRTSRHVYFATLSNFGITISPIFQKQIWFRPELCRVILQKLREPRSRIISGDISDNPTNHEHHGYGDFNLEKLDLTSAPWSRIMLSPFWETLFIHIFGKNDPTNANMFYFNFP